MGRIDAEFIQFLSSSGSSIQLRRLKFAEQVTGVDFDSGRTQNLEISPVRLNYSNVEQAKTGETLACLQSPYQGHSSTIVAVCCSQPLSDLRVEAQALPGIVIFTHSFSYTSFFQSAW